MKRFSLAVFALLITPIAAWAQPVFDSGSNGSYGALHVTESTTLDLPPDGIFHCTTIQVAAGKTLQFRRNARNTPVYLLAQGEVVIQGTVDVSARYSGSSIPGPMEAGPGGFEGGVAGRGDQPSGDGYGPGGGRREGGAAGFGSKGSPGDEEYGRVYGSPLLIPLIGGSGGGGNGTASGGGGGGAILIASSIRVILTGQVRALGGEYGGLGSGGAVRLVAPEVAVQPGPQGDNFVGSTIGGTEGVLCLGRVRIDTLVRSSLNPRARYMVLSVGGNMVAFPPNPPSLEIVEVAGKPVDPAAGAATVALPFGAAPEQTVKIRARNFDGKIPLNVVMTPQNGAARFVYAEIDTSAGAPSEHVLAVTLPVNIETHLNVWAGPGIRKPTAP